MIRKHLGIRILDFFINSLLATFDLIPFMAFGSLWEPKATENKNLRPFFIVFLFKLYDNFFTFPSFFGRGYLEFYFHRVGSTCYEYKLSRKK